MRQEIKVIGIDPGTNVTGICYAKSNPYEIVEAKAIEIKNEETLEQKCFFISDSIKLWCDSFKPTHIAIEHPSFCTYTKGMRPQHMIARANSVIKLFSLIYYIKAYIRGVAEVIDVNPRDWELSKKQRNNLPVKEWSMMRAEMLVNKYGANKRVRNLKFYTVKSENIADSINIAWTAISLSESRS